MAATTEQSTLFEPTPRNLRAAAASAAIRLLPQLVDAHTWNHRSRFEEVCSQLAAVIEPTHPAIAKKLVKVQGMQPVPMAMPNDLLSFEQPRFGLDAVVLPAAADAECRRIIEEHARRLELLPYNLAPRHKVLLYGPTGNGKTTLAEALAYEMQIPFLRVKYGAVISSYLGDTSRQIDKILSYASSGPCVLFFDEFDGIGIDRESGSEIGEIRRITNHLLITIERLPSTCMFLAATNLMRLVDKALRRRFDFVIELPHPSTEARASVARLELDPGQTAGKDLSGLVPRLAALPLRNLDAVAKLCRSLRRDLALSDGANIEQILSLASAASNEEEQ